MSLHWSRRNLDENGSVSTPAEPAGGPLTSVVFKGKESKKLSRMEVKHIEMGEIWIALR